MNINYTRFKTVNGTVLMVNTTPHPVNIQDKDGNVQAVPNNPELLINAATEEVRVSPFLVKTLFNGTEEGSQRITAIENWAKEKYPTDTLIIVGSIIAAQAYPGKVFGLTPVPGYERVSPAEKRMNCDKFTTF